MLHSRFPLAIGSLFYFISLIFKIYLFIGCSGSLLLLGLSFFLERGLLFVAVCGLLIGVASLVAHHGF